MSGRYDWHEIPEWENLDLSSLETLKFYPPASLRTTKRDVDEMRLFSEPPLGIDLGLKAGMAVHALISKCRGSLRSLDISSDTSYDRWLTVWPVVPPTFGLPSLEVLSLRYHRVHANLLGPWLQAMPRVHILEMVNSFPLPLEGAPGSRSWMSVFDAIRDHSNVTDVTGSGIGVYLDRIRTGDDTCITYGGRVHREPHVPFPRPTHRVQYDKHVEIGEALDAHFTLGIPSRNNLALNRRLRESWVLQHRIGAHMGVRSYRHAGW